MAHLMMSLFVALAIGYSSTEETVIISEENKDITLPIAIKCLEEAVGDTSALKDLEAMIRRNNYKEKEALSCFGNKAGIRNEDGTIKAQVAKKFYPKDLWEKVAAAYEDCNKNQEKDPIEKTFNIFVCVFNEFPIELNL